MIFIPGIDDVDEVLAIRKLAIETLKSGGLEITEWTSDSVSVRKARSLDIEKLLEEITDFLRIVDPDLYGSRIKRAYPVYTNF